MVKRVAAQLVPFVMLVTPANAAENWRCRIEEVHYNLPTQPPKTKLVRPNLEYAIQFDVIGFSLVPVKGDLITAFRIIRNSPAALLGSSDRENKTLDLDKRRHTIKTVGHRADGTIAYVQTGTCAGP